MVLVEVYGTGTKALLSPKILVTSAGQTHVSLDTMSSIALDSWFWLLDALMVKPAHARPQTDKEILELQGTRIERKDNKHFQYPALSVSCLEAFLWMHRYLHLSNFHKVYVCSCQLSEVNIRAIFLL